VKSWGKGEPSLCQALRWPCVGLNRQYSSFDKFPIRLEFRLTIERGQFEVRRSFRRFKTGCDKKWLFQPA
jgi:hypothetical protein